MSKARINWDAEMDRKLFLAILKVHDVSVDHAAVAKLIATDDQPCTPLAIKKRLQKIKAQIKSGEGTEDKSTPAKRDREASGSGTPDSESPVKKIKIEKTTTGEE